MTKCRRRGRIGSLVITLGPPLALMIYFGLLERYGFQFLELDDDPEFIEAAP